MSGEPGGEGHRGALLVIDTALSRCVVATANLAGVLDGVTTWPAGYRHSETLLPSIARLLVERGIPRSGLAGIVVGTGPGAFTGLRVGLATAKTLAVSLGIRLVGIPTGHALLDAAAAGALGNGPVPLERLALVLPAGPTDRLVIRAGAEARLIQGPASIDLEPGAVLIALDLEGRAPADALARGEQAWAGFPASLARLGAGRLANGGADDPALLTPDYVTLPRGITAMTGEVTWSRDPR